MPGCFIIALGKLTYILAENWTLLELFLDVRTVEIQMLLYIVFSSLFVRSFVHSFVLHTEGTRDEKWSSVSVDLNTS